MRISLPRFPLAASMRVIHRIHRQPPNDRSPPHPARPSGLSDRDILMIEISNLSHGRKASAMDLPQLPRTQPDLNIVRFSTHNLCNGPGAPGQLPPLPGLQFQVMDLRAHGNEPQRQSVSGLDLGITA